jgi:MYXO-CTERM domain-containing protein
MERPRRCESDGCGARCEVEPGYSCFELDGPSECFETCGDGLIHVEAGEECDDGEENSDTRANACRERCVRAHCGDAVIDDGEECDVGANNSDTMPGVCRTSCRLPYCGDGVVDEGEACDPGGGMSLPSSSCEGVCAPPDAGVADAGLGGGANAGCGCRAVGGSPAPWTWMAVLGACVLGWRIARRRR